MRSNSVSGVALLVPALLLSSMSAQAQTCWKLSAQQLGARLISTIGEKHLVSTSVRKGQPDEFEILVDEEVITVTPTLSTDGQICSIGIDTGSRSVAPESLAILRTILDLTDTGFDPQKADYNMNLPKIGNSFGGDPELLKSELKFIPNKKGGYLISISAKQ